MTPSAAAPSLQSAPMTLPRLGFGCRAPEIIRALREHGVVVLENALPVERLQQLDYELAPVFDLAEGGRGAFLGRRTRRFSALFARSSEACRLALHPEILPAVEAILFGDPDKPSCEKIQINFTQAIAIDPGEPAQALHRDEGMFPVELPYELMINVMWMLDPFTEENGALHVAPGSHRTKHWPEPGEATVAATGPAGSCVIWLGSLIHGGGANRSRIPRRGICMSYSLGWLQQAEKLLLSTPLEVVRRLPRRLQQLIGYQVHLPYVGWIEGRDPIEWLDGQFQNLAAAEDCLTDEIRERLERDVANRGASVT